MKQFIPLLFLASLVWAQNNPPRFQSPEVHEDKRVTFRLHAPEATAVTLRGEWMKQPGQTPLVKGDNGVWSLTVGPLQPELMYYRLYVDGVAIADPRNPLIAQGTGGPLSLVDVPGPEAAFHALSPVPHGAVHIHWYMSKATGKARRLRVYTPPGYDASKRTKYPVLYLLHGSGDTDDGWSTIGRTNWILDNLIAARKATPMLVVMPDGHTVDPNADAAARRGNTKLFAQDLMESIVPLTESTYRVAAGSQNRALAGLSMGGGQTLNVGLAHPEKFSYLGVFSAGGANVEISSGDTLNKQLRLLWIGCGSADAGIKAVKVLVEKLKTNNVKHVFRETDGAGHQWPLWRAQLNEFAPLLFRKTS